MSKKFSKLEQEIVSSLLKLDSKKGLNVLGNIITRYLPAECYIDISSESQISLMLRSQAEDTVDLNKIESDLLEFLVTLFSLLEYLKSQRYIYFLGDYDFKSLGEKISRENYIPCGFIDDELKRPLYLYARGRFFVTETFKQFVANGYKTESEKKYSKELFYTRAALGIALLGLLASIFVPLYSTTSIEIQNEVLNTSAEKGTHIYVDRKFEESKMTMEALKNELRIISTSLNERLELIEKSENLGLEDAHDSIENIRTELKELTETVNNSSPAT